MLRLTRELRAHEQQTADDAERENRYEQPNPQAEPELAARVGTGLVVALSPAAHEVCA